MTLATLPVRLRIDAVQHRTVAMLRAQWLPILVLSFGLGYVPQVLLDQVVPSHYVAGSHNVPAFAAHAAQSVGEGLLARFAAAAVIAASMSRERSRLLLPSIAAVVSALPALTPIWFFDETDAVWGFWITWIQPAASTSPASMVAFGYATIAGAWTVVLLGLAAFLALAVITPVIVAERQGLLASMRTTWRLMRGNRWPMFGLLLLFGVAVVIAAIPLVAVGFAHPAKDVTQDVRWVVGAVSHALSTVWWVVLAASYLELKRLHGGALHEELATVFD